MENEKVRFLIEALNQRNTSEINDNLIDYLICCTGRNVKIVYPTDTYSMYTYNIFDSNPIINELWNKVIGDNYEKVRKNS